MNQIASLRCAFFASDLKQSYNSKKSLVENFVDSCRYRFAAFKQPSLATKELMSNLTGYKMNVPAEDGPLTYEQWCENLQSLQNANREIVKWHEIRKLHSSRTKLVENFQEEIIKNIEITQNKITQLLDKEFTLEKSLLENFESLCPIGLSYEKGNLLRSILEECDLIYVNGRVIDSENKIFLHDLASTELAILALREYIDKHPESNNFLLKSFLNKVLSIQKTIENKNAEELQDANFGNNVSEVSERFSQYMVAYNPKYEKLESNAATSKIKSFFNFFLKLIRHKEQFEPCVEPAPDVPVSLRSMENAKESKRRNFHGAILMPLISPFMDIITNADCVDCFLDICTNFY